MDTYVSMSLLSLHICERRLGVDAKSEFAYEGQKLGQRSIGAKMRKYVLL